MKEILKLWRTEITFKIYVILVLIAFIKQCFDLTVLIDTGEYFNAAHNFREHLNFDSCYRDRCEHILHETRRTPGFPLLVIAAFFSHYALIAVQVFISVLVPVWCRKLMDQYQMPAELFKKVQWLLLLYPMQFFYSVIPMPEIWCQLLVLISVVLFLRQNWPMLGLCAAALVLLKPVFLIAMLALALFSFFQIQKRFWLLIPALVVTLVSLLNLVQTGKLHYTSIGVENAWEYNQRAILNHVMTPEEMQKYYLKHDAIFARTNIASTYELMQSEVRKNILAHWKIYMFLHAKGCLMAALDPGRYDLVAFFKIPEGQGFMSVKNDRNVLEKVDSQPLGILIYMGIFLIVNILRWSLFAYALLRNFKKWWSIAALVVVFIGVTGPVGSARYLFPFMPLICIVAAHGWHLFVNRNEKDTAVK